MLPTIVLGYLAIRTAETEKLVVWERLKESYTSIANMASDHLEYVLSLAEGDFRGSVSALTDYDKDALQRLSHQLENEHGVISQVFFVNASGKMIFPEDPRRMQQNDRNASLSQEEKDIFESYLADGERQEFKHNNPQYAIYDYQKILSDLKDPVYKAIALNGMARCYAKLGSNQEAIDHYNEIIDNYIDVTDGWLQMATVAYLQLYSIHKTMGDTDAAIEALMSLYGSLSDRGWNLDAEEISYFADKTRRHLLTYRDRGDTFFSSLADRFAETDTKVIQLVRLQRFLKNYGRLAADDMKKVVNRADGDPELMLHLRRSTNTGPYFLSYISMKRKSSDSPALAGFQVDLDYLASQGFNEILSELLISDDVTLAILNENNEVVTTPPGMEYSTPIPSGKPITTAVSSSLPFWKVGLYPKDPQSLERLTRRKAGLRIFMIAGLILTIAFGIYLAMREARREAELARLRSDFVANVSHELRTPLSSIQIFSETLKQNRTTSREKQEQYLDTISSESDRLARLVDNVLNFSRLERHAKEFDFRLTNIGEVVGSAVEAYRFYAEQRGATINLNIAPELPQMEADAEAISQMVINLVDNAVKYSEDEGEITVNVFRRGGNIIIQVVDRGVGINEEDLKKIFDKFYRGKNVANLGTGGTGLGLTLAKAVAEAHGGDIRVRSKEGAGSRFSAILPLSRKGSTDE
jgi:signal transduction histidine kinase